VGGAGAFQLGNGLGAALLAQGGFHEVPFQPVQFPAELVLFGAGILAKELFVELLNPLQAGPTGLLVEFTLSVRLGFIGIHESGDLLLEPFDFLLSGELGGGALFALAMQPDEFLRQ